MPVYTLLIVVLDMIDTLSQVQVSTTEIETTPSGALKQRGSGSEPIHELKLFVCSSIHLILHFQALPT